LFEPGCLMKKRADIILRQYLTHEGEILRYQILEMPFPLPLKQLQGKTDLAILEDLKSLYLKNLLPAKPEYTGVVLFCCDHRVPDPFPERDGDIVIKDQASRVRWWINKYYRNGHPEEQIELRKYLESLEKAQLLVSGGDRESHPLYLPVYPEMTKLSSFYHDNTVTLNSHFFLMEISDLLSPFDRVGEPFGMLSVDGEILHPPLYSRETLISYKSGDNAILKLSIEDMTIIIDGKEYSDKENCRIFRRPEYGVSPIQDGLDLIIAGNNILAYSTAGGCPVPEAGFILHLENTDPPSDLRVSYRYRKDLNFSIQVGPAMVEGGDVCEGFSTDYYQGTGVPFPPTVYPLDWSHGRAARTGLGFKEKKLVLIGIEGSKKAVYKAGYDSTGCSLEEMAQLCKESGIDNMINLDGGGSSQISVMGKRSLKISDRSLETGEDFERPVPLGLELKIR
jgi:Phosphodiester glycosidase